MATQSGSGDISTVCSEQNSLADTRGNGYVADKLQMMILPNLNRSGDKILHTPIVERNTLVGRLRPRSVRGRLQAKPERLCFFVILVTHPRA